MSISRHYGSLQLRAIDKLGDAMIPGDGELPAFSSSGSVARVDRVLDYMPEGDRGDLKLLLTIIGLMPRFAVRWLVGLLERSPRMGGPIGPTLRLIHLGLRGIVMSLYYSGPEAFKGIGYQVGVYQGDLDR